MTTSTIGLFVGLLLAISAAAGGFTGFLFAVILAVVGFAVGRYIDGELDVSMFQSRDGFSRGRRHDR